MKISADTIEMTNHGRVFYKGTIRQAYSILLKYISDKPKSTALGHFLITADDETFGYSRYLDYRFIAELVYEGYLPIAYQEQSIYILAKLHAIRSVIKLDHVHIPRSVKKRKKEFRMTVDCDYEGVCEGVRKVHGHGWLYPEISLLYKQLKDSDYIPNLRVITVEIYKDDKLVAGELGYTLGNIYSSLTGFYDRDYSGSGRVQLETLRCLLFKKGIKYWDLGMMMDYKTEMGALGIPRREWLDLVKRNRDSNCDSLVGYNSGPDLCELFSNIS